MGIIDDRSGIYQDGFCAVDDEIRITVNRVIVKALPYPVDSGCEFNRLRILRSFVDLHAESIVFAVKFGKRTFVRFRTSVMPEIGHLCTEIMK